MYRDKKNSVAWSRFDGHFQNKWECIRGAPPKKPQRKGTPETFQVIQIHHLVLWAWDTLELSVDAPVPLQNRGHHFGAALSSRRPGV